MDIDDEAPEDLKNLDQGACQGASGCYADLMTNTAKVGAFCNRADAIVPLDAPLFECDWCGSRHHFIRYEWTWKETEGRHVWETISYAEVDGKEIAKPENYTEDGI